MTGFIQFTMHIIDHDYAICSLVEPMVEPNIYEPTSYKKNSILTEMRKRMWKKSQMMNKELMKKKYEIRQPAQEMEEQPVYQRYYAGYVPFCKSEEGLVQIEAGHQAVTLRIENFQAHKREYINELNIREFCEPSYKIHGYGCARTDSVVVKKINCKSHIKVHRVFNKWGPMTRGIDPGSIPHLDPPDPLHQMIKDREDKLRQESFGECSKSIAKDLPPGWLERLDNVEMHMKLKSTKNMNVHSRIKLLEEKILQLEGISPEYADREMEFSDGPKVEYVPLNKRAYSKYELTCRMAMLQGGFPIVPAIQKKKKNTKRSIKKSIK